jgi:beta-galactosidase beta subunit
MNIRCRRWMRSLGSRGGPEAHELHADIQFLVSGEEKIGVLRLPGKLEVTEDRMESDDVASLPISTVLAAMSQEPAGLKRLS